MGYQFTNNWPYTYTVFPTMEDHIDPVNHEYFEELHTEIENIENELGLEPSASYNTVKDRLGAINEKLTELEEDIAAINTELGSDPSGPFDTVKLRLENIESDIDNLEAGILTGTMSNLACLSEATQPMDNQQNKDVTDGNLRLRTLATNVHFIVPIQMLRSGTITAVTGCALCVGVNNVITIKLCSRSLVPGAIVVHATLVKTNCDGSTYNSTGNITTPEMNTGNKAYFLDIEFDADTSVDNCILYGVRVTYIRP